MNYIFYIVHFFLIFTDENYYVVTDKSKYNNQLLRKKIENLQVYYYFRLVYNNI